MKKLLNNAVAVIVVMIVLLLIIPLNPFVLDVFIILNISISLIILLISMNIKRAAGVFDFSIHAFDHDVVPISGSISLPREISLETQEQQEL